MRGNIDDSEAELHVEFANAFVGGGVMTGDAAMEETLFLVKPELMVAMALQERMVDEEAVCVSNALKYSKTEGFGQSFEFGGDYENTVTKSVLCCLFLFVCFDHSALFSTKNYTTSQSMCY